MSDGSTADVFTPHVGKAFRPRGQPHVLTLVSIDTRRGAGWEDAPRAPFSLLLRGERDYVLPEGLYTFDIDGGADAEFYIMPIHTPARSHQNYQVVFT